MILTLTANAPIVTAGIRVINIITIIQIVDNSSEYYKGHSYACYIRINSRFCNTIVLTKMIIIIRVVGIS